MNILRNTGALLIALAMVIAPSAFADTWPPAQGDLVLGVQAESGTGSNTNLFFNLGSATDLRDAPNAGALGNIAAEMTATFGAGWESRTDLYFGVIANFNNAPLSGPSAGGVTNGDPTRTIYASRPATSDGSSLPFSGFNSSGLGTVATILKGQYSMLSTLTANGNNVATVSTAEPAKFANGWTQYNPFITSGVQGAAYTIIGGGIQQTFDANGSVKVDIQRILPTTGNGTYVATITVADNGDITASGTATTYRTLTLGTATGGQINGLIDGTLFADGSTVTLTAVPGGSGTVFGGWTGDASGSVNPLTVTLDANKTIGANFITLTGTWPPAPGDLVLGFQAESGTGSNVNLFANLGPASDVRDNPALGTVAILGNELTNTYGANWFTRDDLYFGVLGNFSNAPLSGPSAGDTTNGDPTRTVYVSRATDIDGGSIPFTINQSGLGTAATILKGQYTMLGTVPVGTNESATVSSAEPAKFANGWSAHNPFIAAGVQGAGFTVFGGGIQNHFNQGGPAKVDLQRIVPNGGVGTYVATISIDGSGNVSIGGTATSYFTLTQGTVNGGQINGLIGGSALYAQGSTITLMAVPSQGGSVFTGWTGDASGSVNPLTVTFDANKTIGADFGPDLTDVDLDGISAADEIGIHNTDPGIANTPPAFPPTVAHVSTTAASEAEISAYDPASRNLFVTTQGAGLAVFDITNPNSPNPVSTIDFTQAPFSLTGTAVTSVASKNGTVAVAVVDGVDKNNPGHVVFLDAATLNHLGTATVGSLPDMVTFTPDGNKVLTANEGEAYDDGNLGFGTALGTVSIIDVSGGFAAPPVTTADFTAFDSQRDALFAAGVRIFSGEGDGLDNDGDSSTDEPGELQSPSMDFEPEYIAVSPDSTTAMVTLQENNAVALLNLTTGVFTSVVPLGEKDFSGLLADFSDRDGIGATQIGHMTTGNPVFGLYMPDAIDTLTVSGQTYYVIANEGDDRDDFLTNEETARVKDGTVDLDDTVFPNEADLKMDANLGRLTISNSLGLRGDTDGDGDIDKILALGGRSFSVLDSSGNMVFDSDDLIEKAIQSYGLPFFDDGRSDNKGPEPEGVEIGEINGSPKAFIGLERSNGVMMFDISNPMAPVFEAFLQEAGDVSPEGLTFIPAADSPTAQALLVVTNEVSGTFTIFSFDVPTFDLTIDTPTNGSITGASSGPVPANDVVNLTAVPDAGYSFTGWTGDASGTTNPLAVTMDANKTIGATFAPDATDGDGNNFSDFEEAQLEALMTQHNVGDTVDIDLSFLDDSTLRIVVSGLPKGLTYDPNTGHITGTILAAGGDAGAVIKKLNGRKVVGSLPLAFSIADYPFIGTYQALIETADPLPAGEVKITVSKVGVWTGVLEVLGEKAPRRARGTFVNSQGATQQIVANFTNRRLGDLGVTINLSTTSDLVDGTVTNGNTLRGFRIAKPVRNPGGTVKLSVGLFPDAPGDSTNVPAGTGYLMGTVNNKGIINLHGTLGDGQKTSTSFCLAQSNQGVLWKMPYRGLASYIGGIVDIGDLGQASRGGAPAGDPNPGIKWFKEAGIAREKSYVNGFAVQDLTGMTSRWIPVPNAQALADSLGLQFREIDAAYVGDADPKLPTRFSLRNTYRLLPVQPITALRTVVKANRSTGAFKGTMLHTDGKSGVEGILLQDESFGTDVGVGLIKIPVVGVRGAFRTVSIEMMQTP
ncbi:MAG: choice-of-anchor I family protein [Verrucomicrobiae bacterium]|nr:choice-of-anchor I family protein [Verrucomicrobiae bacterium]